jgi:hypothetical protein
MAVIAVAASIIFQLEPLPILAAVFLCAARTL